MNSGTHPVTNAPPTDSNSAAAHSPTSRQSANATSRQSPSSSRHPKSHSPDTSKKRRTSQSTSRSDAPLDGNGQQDSEAETVHLSDEGKDAARPVKKIKQEPNGESVARSPLLATRSEPNRSAPGSRASSVANDAFDKTGRHLNGGRPNGLKDGSAKHSALGKASHMRDADSKSPRAHSVDTSNASGQDSSTRARSVGTSEPRKRKMSDVQRSSKLEPPRQRPRLDGLSRQRVSSPLNNTSPPASARTHRRSTSTQLPRPPSSAPPRPRRDTQSNASDERNDWNSDTGSDGVSPRPRNITILPAPRSNRSRAATSPAPSMPPHGKKTDKFGLTALARACEKGNLEMVITAYQHSPDELNFADNAGYAPLQKAALEGHADIVEFLLNKGCKVDCHSKNGDTPLIDAVENGHLDVVKMLLTYQVNPHHQNERGQRALDLVNTDDEDAGELKSLLDKAMKEYEGPESDDDGPIDSMALLTSGKSERKDLLHKEGTVKNLRDYAQRGDAEAVLHFVNMGVKPDIACCVAAARGGHEMALSLMLSDARDKDPDPTIHSETPLTAAIGRGHLRVLKLILDQTEFNPCRRTKEGKTYWQLSEERQGPKWQAERDLLKDAYDVYRAAHGGKVIKKKKLPESTNHRRTSSGSKAEVPMRTLSSPKSQKQRLPNDIKDRAPKLKPPEEGTKGDLAQRKRLASAKDAQIKDGKQRRRRVVDDESSAADSDESDEDESVSKKAVVRRRKSSTASRSSQLAPRPGDEDKQSSTAHAKIKRESSLDKPKKKLRDGSPNVERKKRTVKPMPNTKSDVRSVTLDANSDMDVDTNDMGPSRKEDSPDSILESRRALEKAEQEKADMERAEQERKDKEEADRQEALRLEELRKAKEEAERLRKEQEEMETRRRAQLAREAAERKSRQESAPDALRYAMQLGPHRPLYLEDHNEDIYDNVNGIKGCFLPILEWPLYEIDRACDPANAEAKYMLSFQVIGLFGLPDLYLEENEVSALARKKIPASQEQKDKFVRGYFIDKIASHTYVDSFWCGPKEKRIDPNFNPDMAEWNLHEEAREKLRTLEMFFVPVSDVLKLVPDFPHLSGLEITTAPGPPIRKSEGPNWYQQALLKSQSVTPAGTPRVDSSMSIKVNGIIGEAVNGVIRNGAKVNGDAASPDTKEDSNSVGVLTNGHDHNGGLENGVASVGEDRLMTDAV